MFAVQDVEEQAAVQGRLRQAVTHGQHIALSVGDVVQAGPLDPFAGTPDHLRFDVEGQHPAGDAPGHGQTRLMRAETC